MTPFSSALASFDALHHGRASLILALSTLLEAVGANFALGGFGENFMTQQWMLSGVKSGR